MGFVEEMTWKCAVRSEDCLSHIKVVVTRRGFPVCEQGPDANANGSEEKHHHHQRISQSSRPSWLKDNHKPAHSQHKLIFALWAALLEQRFQAFGRLHYQEVLYNSKAPVDGKQFLQSILPSLLLVVSCISLPADIKRCANPATWGEENKKHACQCSPAPDKDIQMIRFYWIPQQQLRCKPQFLLIVTLGLSLLSSIFSPLNLLPNKGQACSAMEKSSLTSPWWEAS